MSTPRQSSRGFDLNRARDAAASEWGRKLLVEFIGTFFLVFTVCMATSSYGAGVIAPLAIGSVLMVMVFAGGRISGGHYNPAVSTAVAVRGKLEWHDWAGYVVAQAIAAIVAGLIARGLVGGEPNLVLGSVWKILIVEFLFTFALGYVVVNVATARATEGNSYFGLAIGFTVLAGAFAVGGISGGAFNPAVALGASIIGIFEWGHYWAYLVAELLGGAVAGWVFLFLAPEEAEPSRRRR